MVWVFAPGNFPGLATGRPPAEPAEVIRLRIVWCLRGRRRTGEIWTCVSRAGPYPTSFAVWQAGLMPTR
jgi:hypothetical protein